MPAFNKINKFVQDLCQGVHNLNTGVLTIALTKTANAPTADSAILSDITQIVYANLSARVPTNSGCTQTSGTVKLVLQDLVLTASGTVAAFGAIVLYNSSPSSPVNPLIAWWLYGSDITMANNDTFTIDFDPVGGVLTVT